MIEPKMKATRNVRFLNNTIGILIYSDGTKIYIGRIQPPCWCPFVMIKNGSRWECDKTRERRISLTTRLPLDSEDFEDPGDWEVVKHLHNYIVDDENIVQGTQEELREFLMVAGNKDDISSTGPGMSSEEAMVLMLIISFSRRCAPL